KKPKAAKQIYSLIPLSDKEGSFDRRENNPKRLIEIKKPKAAKQIYSLIPLSDKEGSFDRRENNPF
ncbi:hypothetical protein, partial [Cryomorpha ignava]|uniref:hypothetical protein n=1 Tax=Cryomorpha ignava TaxID=101383 RepID=UPI00195423FB